MGRFGVIARAGIAGLIFLMLTACAAVYRNHGYTPRDADLEQIVVGTTTREEVATLIGRPSSSGVLADSGWYYVGSRWRYFAYQAPQEIERQVVAISFSKAGIVENVERFTLADGQLVTLSRRVTDSNIKGVSFLKQILGNFGRITTDQLAP